MNFAGKYFDLNAVKNSLQVVAGYVRVQFNSAFLSISSALTKVKY